VSRAASTSSTERQTFCSLPFSTIHLDRNLGFNSVARQKLYTSIQCRSKLPLCLCRVIKKGCITALVPWGDGKRTLSCRKHAGTAGAAETQRRKGLRPRSDMPPESAISNSCQWTVSELARNVGLSDSRFYHLFHRDAGVSPARYLRECKLREAAHLIQTTSLPVKDVLQIVGVDDPSHFIRNSRKRFGLCPTLYRLSTAVRAVDQPITSSSLCLK
jgi:AraC-like DNA-binding protein